jgi:hypothetical protein
VKNSIAVILCALALLAPAAGPAALSASDDGTPIASGPPSPGAAAFALIKSLEGEWRAPEGKTEMINIFRPFAFGTAILHEEWKDGAQLTATAFYMVGDELRADHFCDFQNQLRYTVKPTADGKGVSFELREALNLDTHPRHFHASGWALKDATHLAQDWHIAEPGKPMRSVHLDFTRRL